MRDKILQLCKRLNKFTLDEIATISELEPKNLKNILDELIAENKIIEENGQYLYVKKVRINQEHRIFQYYDARIIDILIRAFCSDIPSYKAAQISGLENRTTEKFYTIFRAAIYTEQKRELDIYYKQSPQIARHRKFFDKETYMYIYNRQVFISKNLLKSKADKTLNQKDKAEFTKIYCYLTRNLTHNKNAYNLEYKIAETIWRRNKEFQELYEQLIQLVNG